MKTIWKYEVKPGRFELELPEFYRPLTVQMQGDRPVVWIMVDPISPICKRQFLMVGTGHDFEPYYDYGVQAIKENLYVGTFQIDGLVFHLFDLG